MRTSGFGPYPAGFRPWIRTLFSHTRSPVWNLWASSDTFKSAASWTVCWPVSCNRANEDCGGSGSVCCGQEHNWSSFRYQYYVSSPCGLLILLLRCSCFQLSPKALWCSPGWLWILRDLIASALQVMGFQAGASRPSHTGSCFSLLSFLTAERIFALNSGPLFPSLCYIFYHNLLMYVLGCMVALPC